jgi:septum site-determining protein MinD
VHNDVLQALTVLTLSYTISQHTAITTTTDAERAANDDMLRVDDIKELLGLELLGLIPESKSVLTATNMGQPVIMMDASNSSSSSMKQQANDAAVAYADAVSRLLGETVPVKFLEPKKQTLGFLRKLFA